MNLSLIKKKLDFLYDNKDSEYAFNEIKKLVLNFKGKSSKKINFSNKDVILITYGDSLVEKNVKSLKIFSKFSRFLKSNINSIHFLPFFPYTSDDGFSIVDYRKIDPKLGDFNDVKKIGKKFNLMFDFVLNHCSKSSRYFKEYLKENDEFKDFFLDIDPKTDLSDVFRPRMHPLLTKFGNKNVWTTFSEDQVDLNFSNPKVLVEMISIMLFYIKNNAKLLRLDAVAFMWKKIGTSCLHLKETHEVIKILRLVLDMTKKDVVIVTETNVPHKENISYFGKDYDEAQMVYQFPLPPLVFHAFLKGDATHILKWLKGIKEGMFFNFLASHDGIGILPTMGLIPEKERLDLLKVVKKHNGHVSYKAVKDGKIPYEMNINYFDALSDPNNDDGYGVKRFIAAYAIALSLKGVPGIYIHSLLGSRNWCEGVKITGRYRTINREKLSFSRVVRELKDKDSLRYKVFNGLMELIKIRRKVKAFSPYAKQEVVNFDKRVFSIVRGEGKEKVLVLINVSSEKVIVKKIKGKDLISCKKINGNLVLEPYQVTWIKKK